MVTRLTCVVAALVAAAGCHDDVTGGLRFTCALDRDCLPGWYCSAASLCERGSADADTHADSDGAASDAEVSVAPDVDATDTGAIDTLVAETTSDTAADSDGEVVDASDADAETHEPGCESLTHVVGRPIVMDSELTLVRDLAFDDQGSVLVAADVLQGAIEGSTTLVPVEGLFGFDLHAVVGSVASLGGGEWVAWTYARSIVRFRLADAAGTPIASDVRSMDLALTSLPTDLLTPATAFLVFLDVMGVAWLVEPAEARGSYHRQPIFGDLLEPTRLAFDANHGTTYIAHGVRGRVTAFDAGGARSDFGVPGTLAPPAVRSCAGLAEDAPCLGAQGGQGACLSADARFCHEVPNVVDPRIPACDGQDSFSDCVVRVAGTDLPGDCVWDKAGALFCYLHQYGEASWIDACAGQTRGDGCTFLGDPRLETPPGFDAESDTDQDGVFNTTEAAYGLDPLDPDWDDDGFFDGHEPSWALDLNGDGAIGAKDLNSDGDGIHDNDDYYLPIPRYGNCLTASEIGRGDLAPDQLVCVDPTDFTTTDPFERPFVSGLAAHPCGGAVFTSLRPGDGQAGVYLEGPDHAVTTLASTRILSALERGGGGRFPKTTLYAFDQVSERIVELVFCDGPCPSGAPPGP